MLTSVAVAVFSLLVLGPPVQAQDNPSAQTQFNLGMKYFIVGGVLQDAVEAVRWTPPSRCGPIIQGLEGKRIRYRELTA